MDEFAAQVGPLLRAWSDSTGFEACGVIATNGKQHGIRVVSAIDIKLMGDTYAGGSYGKQTRRHFQNMSGQDLDEFSQADFLGGAGYLAGTNGSLLFQDGTSQIKRIN